ncbi:hypothetical protein [Arcobacter arenosus]|uniref:hypothetical protein n=1 Tax=Arcobacter arenosus TaxID=2576037 RepID=UPI003BAD4A78
MDIFELKEKLQSELEKGQTIENLVEYVMCDFNSVQTIITKHYAKSMSSTRTTTQRRLVREYIQDLA